MANIVKYPAKLHTERVVGNLLSSLKSSPPSSTSSFPTAATKHVLYLQGQTIQSRDDTDRELPFRQESNFFYLTGWNGPDASLVVEVDGGESGLGKDGFRTTLVVPDVHPDEVMWSGMPPTESQINQTHSFDKVLTRSSLPSHLQSLLPSNSTLHTLPPSSSLPTPPTTDLSADTTTTTSYLLPAIQSARTTKTPHELTLLRRASLISSQAHTLVMSHLSPSLPSTETLKSEAEAEALFVSECRRKGSKWQAYQPIFGSGKDAGTLHYGSNEKGFDVGSKEGIVLLVDAGCEIDGYAADITRTMPVGNGGKFTPEARAIYSIVLNMQDEALALIRPGIHWEDIQLHMHRVAAAGLLQLGILQPVPGTQPSGIASAAGAGTNIIEDLVRQGATVGFFPHGVGHYLGLDVHDVGGLPEGRSKDPLIRYLRLRKVLEEGNVVTVEPGLYFNEFLLEPFKDSPFIDHDVLKRYMSVGGVRIEDNVVVTEDGYENLTTAPKSIEDVERICSTGKI